MVTYEQTTGLKLVCPICHEKVFKRVRKIPNENHSFCHYQGGSPDCELYRPSNSDWTTYSTAGVGRGQSLELFLDEISDDIRQLLFDSGLLVDPLDEQRLEDIEAAVNEYEFDPHRDTLYEIPEHARVNLERLAPSSNLESHLQLLCAFYLNPKSRFIDSELVGWLVYLVTEDDPTLEEVKVLDDLISNSLDLDQANSMIMIALAFHYHGQRSEWLREEWLEPIIRKFIEEDEGLDNAAGQETPSPEDRYRMIEVAAYYNAERDGFKSQNFQRYWKDAERQVDTMLKSRLGPSKSNKE